MNQPQSQSQSPSRSSSSRPPQPGSQPTPVVQKGLHPLPEPVKGAVITVSDRCAAGEREDASGPLAVEPVRTAIAEAVASGARVVLTTGGTGVTPRDLTPEGTAPLLTARLEGIEAQIRAYGLTKTPLSGLSRGLVGVTSREATGALVVNAPGSRGGVKDTVAVVGPLVPHVLEQLGGGDH